MDETKGWLGWRSEWLRLGGSLLDCLPGLLVALAHDAAAIRIEA